MKKSLLILGMICCGIIVPVACVLAGAYEFGGLGPRAAGMGGAFMAVADDWTAPYWNPAGLTQTVGNGFGVELLASQFTAKDGNSIANLDTADMSIDQGDIFVRIYPVEPTSFEETETSDRFLQPFVGGYLDIKGFKIGGGFYIPVGNWVDWRDTVLDVTNAEISASYFTKMYLMVGNLSVAKEIIPNLSFGAGLNLLYIKNEYEAKKSYLTTDPMMMPSYDFLHKMVGSGKNFEGVFGVLYKPSPNLSIGGVYRTGSELDLDGTGDYSLTFEAPAPSPPAETSDYTIKFYHPATYGIGIAYSPIPNLLITADWQGTNWSTWKTDIDYETEGVGLTDFYKDWDWKASNRYRIGGEFKPNDMIALRAGFYYDESPTPDEQVSLTNIADVSRKAITLGAGYEWKNLHFDFVYEYLFGDREVDGVEYSINAHGVTLAIYLRI
ncbi:outer membrane protein transport protein [candidate division WOR-3 bacterium]|nr:outer membrane protein transport protein [candidate division WOR-3 bacterium]